MEDNAAAIGQLAQVRPCWHALAHCPPACELPALLPITALAKSQFACYLSL